MVIEMLTYVHFYDEQGKYLDHGKILDVEPYVGYVKKRHATEGYIPWEITMIVPDGTSFGDNPRIKATVKVHPYVKTHCNHEWLQDSGIKFSDSKISLHRQCQKCRKTQDYNFGKSMWENRDEYE